MSQKITYKVNLYIRLILIKNTSTLEDSLVMVQGLTSIREHVTLCSTIEEGVREVEAENYTTCVDPEIIGWVLVCKLNHFYFYFLSHVKLFYVISFQVQ